VSAEQGDKAQSKIADLRLKNAERKKATGNCDEWVSRRMG